MWQHTDSSKNDILLRYLKIVKKCYSTGYFEELFPLLSENVKWESQSVWEPVRGKENVQEYYKLKETALHESGCFPDVNIVQFIGNLNSVRNAHMNVNGQPTHGSIGLFYDDGKYALLMRQTLPDTIVHSIIDLTLDENDLIKKIDICLPEFFRFEIMDDDGKPLAQAQPEEDLENGFEISDDMIFEIQDELDEGK